MKALYRKIFRTTCSALLLVFGFATYAQAQPYTYKGGDVVADAQIVVVYWGKQRAGLQIQLDQYYRLLTRSPYFDSLSEYSTPTKVIGRATYQQSVAIRPDEGAVQVDTVEVAREIDRQILSGHLPAPTANTIYAVHFGQFMDVVMGSNIFGIPIGGEAGIGFCAYHFAARAQAPTPVPGIAIFGPKIRIAVIPDPDRVTGRSCKRGLSHFQATTFLSSHEVVETITNPDSVLIELPPVIGANVQCDGVRIPASSLTPVLASPPAINGIVPWSWTSNASQFCNPDEVADSGSCNMPTLYSTNGTSAGEFMVSPIFLNSRGACTMPASGRVSPPPPPPRPISTKQACLSACQSEQQDCISGAHSGVQRGMCARTGLLCKSRC